MIRGLFPEFFYSGETKPVTVRTKTRPIGRVVIPKVLSDDINRGQTTQTGRMLVYVLRVLWYEGWLPEKGLTVVERSMTQEV